MERSMGAPTLVTITESAQLHRRPTGRNVRWSTGTRRREVTRPRGSMARGLDGIDLKDSIEGERMLA